MKQVKRSPSDELLLTELACDAKDMIIYEVNTCILVAEEKQDTHQGLFRCYMDNATKEFFIEISSTEMMEAFKQSTLLRFLELAEEVGAETVFVCLSKGIEKKGSHLKKFVFIGFEQLTEEEQRKISMTRTHSLLKYSIVEKEDEEY